MLYAPSVARTMSEATKCNGGKKAFVKPSFGSSFSFEPDLRYFCYYIYSYLYFMEQIFAKIFNIIFNIS